MNTSINIFTKCPYVGNPKTRLSSFFTKSEQTLIAEHLLDNIINEVCRLPLQNTKKNIYIYPRVTDNFLDSYKNVDTFNLIEQRGDNLNIRMLNCINDQAQYAQKVLLFGSDILGLTSEIIENGIHELDNNDAVVGPATDGGYYLIGFKDFSKSYLQSSNLNPEVIRDCLSDKNLSFTELDQLSDIDYPDDILVI